MEHFLPCGIGTILKSIAWNLTVPTLLNLRDRQYISDNEGEDVFFIASAFLDNDDAALDCKQNI
jgi:hypothetical protein